MALTKQEYPKIKGTNYRKFYKSLVEMLSQKSDIHHIDHNHDNNDFTNLVELNKKTHLRYHFLYGKLKNIPCYEYIRSGSLMEEINELHILYKEILFRINQRDYMYAANFNQ